MKSKPLAILHIGVEKTGTTTIQEFLYQNRERLIRQGIFFPELITPRNHRPLAVYCSKSKKSNQFTRLNDIDDPGKREKWKLDFRQLFELEMKKIDGGISTVIFSSEHFTTLLKDKEEISRLESALAPFISSIRILVYIRRQDLIAGSMISNAARAGHHGKMHLESGRLFHKHYYNFFKLINKWSKIFGREKIMIRIFERDQLANNDLLEDFMQQARIEPDRQFMIPGRLNISLSSAAVEAAWFFNNKWPAQQYDGDLNELRKLRLELINRVNKKYPGPGKMLCLEDAKKHIKKYRRSNRRLAKKWLGRKNLFSIDLSMYSYSEGKANPDLIRKLVEDFVKEKGLNYTSEA